MHLIVAFYQRLAACWHHAVEPQARSPEPQPRPPALLGEQLQTKALPKSPRGAGYLALQLKTLRLLNRRRSACICAASGYGFGHRWSAPASL
jgi:hypothetical protein